MDLLCDDHHQKRGTQFQKQRGISLRYSAIVMDATAALGQDGQPVDAAEMARSSNKERRVYVGNLSYEVRSENLTEFMRSGEWGCVWRAWKG